jgi:hypothetical protein
MSQDNLKTAIIYDFDGTLARGNIQETSFIPEIGMDKEEFWNLVGEKKVKEDADQILVYMHLMLEFARQKNISVTKSMLNDHGRTADLFDGLANENWFSRINDVAAEEGLNLGHYILSSGIYEMILGCPIAKEFKQIFASRYIYDEEGIALWPGVAINYTTKTQYLFRINKGVENNWDNSVINSYMADEDRPIPFSRMIFVGDGDTDIPSMKTVSTQGGHSIAVYDPKRDVSSIEKIHRLISENRVDFVAPADYSENSQLDIIIKGILGRIGLSE